MWWYVRPIVWNTQISFSLWWWSSFQLRRIQIRLEIFLSHERAIWRIFANWWINISHIVCVILKKPECVWPKSVSFWAPFYLLKQKCVECKTTMARNKKGEGYISKCLVHCWHSYTQITERARWCVQITLLFLGQNKRERESAIFVVPTWKKYTE